MHLSFILIFTKWLSVMSDVSFRVLLILPPLLLACGFFFYGWFCYMREGLRYLNADLPLTYRQRRYLADMFIVSGKPVQPPAYLSEAEKSALAYMPAMKLATKRMMVGMIAIIIFVAYAVLMSLFGFLR